MPFDKDLILIFSLNEYSFAIDVASLIEVTDGMEISNHKGFTGYFGEIDFHDKPTSLINLREKLSIKGRGLENSPVLVVKVDVGYVAFQVDCVDSIVDKKSINYYEFPEFSLKIKGSFSQIYEWDDKYVACIGTNMLFK